MATNPKLEFYRFKLNHHKENFKTFRDFAIEEFEGSKTITNDEAFELCFKKFMKSFETDYAIDIKKKKAITLINDKKYNKHLDKKPVLSKSRSIFYGVINGGPYGKERIVTNIKDKNDAANLDKDKTVMLYYYIFVYLPPEHNEGFFMIHSNSKEESITNIFRDYIANLFKGKNYNKCIPEAFCPQSFQDEFKKDAIIKSLSFSTTIIENTHSSNTISSFLKEYNIKIEATPKNKEKKISIKSAQDLFKFFSKKSFSTGNKGIALEDFNNRKLNVENDLTKIPKVFEWNKRDNDFVPVVHLNGRINMYSDDTPDFGELKTLCINLFNDEILPEIRPDLYATKH